MENAITAKLPLTSLMVENFAIAIDGPAGSGKSTVAKHLANLLQINYINTGAMYRGITLLAIEQHIKPDNLSGIQTLLSKLKFQFHDGLVWINGRDRNNDVFAQSVSEQVSYYSRIQQVRESMVTFQRQIAQHQDVVMEGRDIGSHVLPNCRFKFFLDASVDVRAKRRYAELISCDEKADLQQIKQNIITRDALDSTRDFSPLVCAFDATIIDTSNLSIDQVVQRIFTIVAKKKKAPSHG